MPLTDAELAATRSRLLGEVAAARARIEENAESIHDAVQEALAEPACWLPVSP